MTRNRVRSGETGQIMNRNANQLVGCFHSKPVKPVKPARVAVALRGGPSRRPRQTRVKVRISHQVAVFEIVQRREQRVSNGGVQSSQALVSVSMAMQL